MRQIDWAFDMVGARSYNRGYIEPRSVPGLNHLGNARFHH